MARSEAIELGAGPPVLFQLAAHPLRWQLLRALAASDRRVGELAAALRLPQSLASYHLGKLRAARLVSAHRSAADGRDSYYRLDLERVRDLLTLAAGTLHPALAAPPGPPTAGATAAQLRLCFLCTGNSARSQMAEALVAARGGGSVLACSAGSQPKPLAAGAVRAMRRRGLDISECRPKHVDELRAQRFDVVISLCDRVREVCPEFRGAPRMLHWSIRDPAAEAQAGGDPDAPFERAAADLETRIAFLLHWLGSAMPTREVTRR